MKIFNIALLVLLVSSCSKYTAAPTSASSEFAITSTEIAITNDVAVQSTPQVIVESPENIAAEKALRDSVQMAQIGASIVDEIEYVDIPHFSTEQRSHVVLSEFRDRTQFEDKVITSEELHNNFHYPTDGHITSDFGWRGSRMHNGIDIKAYLNDPIYAAFDGVVRLARYNGAFGNCIVVHHYNGLETLYAHATKILVKENEQVKAGDIIAKAGRTGRSTGVHLHFEIRVMGDCINPNLILDTKNRSLNDKNLYLTMRSGKIFGSNNESAEGREAEIKEFLSVK